jgi:Zn-dependent protease
MNTELTQPEGSAFSRFMASSKGRLVRVALGVLLITAGTVIGGRTGLAVSVAGLLPLAAGVFNLCPIAPLWGGHFLGASYCPARDRE